MAALRGSRNGLQEFGLLGVVAVLFIALSWLGYHHAAPGQDNLFLNKYNLIGGVATPMSIYAVMAIGMTCVIITGGIDISVGSVMALAALAGAAAMGSLPPDAPGWQSLATGFGVPVIVGLVFGLLNGLCVVGLRLHPFIVTLATMSVARGLASVLPRYFYGETTLPASGKLLPASFTPDFMRWSVGDVEIIPLILMLLVVAAGFIFLTLTVAGRETYAVGGNEEAARFSGIRVNRVKLRAYLICGLCAGLAATISLGRFGTASSITASGYELVVVAAAVIGGASLAGGRGTAFGALLGTLVIALIDNFIVTFLSNQEARLIIIGIAIVVAVAIERVLRGKRT